MSNDEEKTTEVNSLEEVASSSGLDKSDFIAIEDNSEMEKNRFECISCSYIYDPNEGVKKYNIPVGTSFSELDKTTFRCPVCRARIDSFRNIGPKSKPSGFEENLNYGFGANNLTSGQKNVLIFGGLAFAVACFLSLYSLN